MLTDPVWEWADGDPACARWFAVLTGSIVVVAGLLLVWFVLIFSTTLSHPSSPTNVGAVDEEFWVTTLMLLIVVPLSIYIPRRFPILRRLGYSSQGLLLVLPLRRLRVLWTSVSQLGPDWVEVFPGRFALPQRYRLTPNQAEQLTRFLHARWTPVKSPGLVAAI